MNQTPPPHIEILRSRITELEAKLAECAQKEAVQVTHERRLAEEKASRTQGLLNVTGRMAKVGGWELNLQTQSLIWTDEVYRIHEVPRTFQPTLAAAINFYAPEFRPAITEAVRRTIEQGEAFDMELQIITAKGNWLWVHAMGEAYAKEGKTVTIGGTFQDITERKRVEAILRKSEERHRATLRTAMDGIWVVDKQARILEVNHAYCRMSGYTEQELMSMRISDIEVDESSGETISHLEKIISKGGDRFEARHRRKDGRIFDVEVSAQPRPNEDGQMVAFLHDITERKRAEAERVKLEAQLRQAAKMESVGRLAGGVAHDFNNILGVILGHTELALEQVDPTMPIHDNLEEIRKAAQRSAELTRQLLAFGRKQTIAPRVLDLNETVAGMIKMLRRLVGEDIELVWNGKPNLWPVRVDPPQIDQILTNLCVNSRDAITGVGKITLELGCKVLDDAYCKENAGAFPGEYVMLAVSDSGCGMDEETLSHLFEPFFTTKKMGKGTGLGLATVYGIVKQNDGYIEVRSKAGQGSSFRIYLPRHIGEVEKVVSPGVVRAPPPCGATILMVEDETPLLKVTATKLERQGYVVLAASSPEEAIRLFKEQSGEISLLITDVIMPNMSGWDLAQYLLSLNPKLKLIFMSGYSSDHITPGGALDNELHFIRKPFSVQDLSALILKALNTAPG